MVTHFHSADGRFCGSQDKGRRFTTDPNKVTCGKCADKDRFKLSPQGEAYVKSLEQTISTKGAE